MNPKLIAALDEARKLVDELAGVSETIASLVPVVGTDIKIAVAALKSGLDAADTAADSPSGTIAQVIIAAIKGAVAGV